MKFSSEICAGLYHHVLRTVDIGCGQLHFIRVVAHGDERVFQRFLRGNAFLGIVDEHLREKVSKAGEIVDRGLEVRSLTPIVVDVFGDSCLQIYMSAVKRHRTEGGGRCL